MQIYFVKFRLKLTSKAGLPRLARPPRPGSCLDFAFQYTLIRNNRWKKFGLEYWALPGSNLPWRPCIEVCMCQKQQLCCRVPEAFFRRHFFQTLYLKCLVLIVQPSHGLWTPREKIAFTARPKIQSQSQIFRYGRSIFCLPHRPNFSDIFDLCLHWVFVVREPSNMMHDERTNRSEICTSEDVINGNEGRTTIAEGPLEPEGQRGELLSPPQILTIH